MSVELYGIIHRFDTRWALQKRDVLAKRGETVAVMGPNGSGKSTLLKIIATLLSPTKGEGTILNYDLKQKAEIRSQMFWLGHDFNLYPFLTARENLIFSMESKGEKPNFGSIDQALVRVGLGAQANHSVATFSAGMKKRLALAKPLIQQPKLILLDEPHTNLDAQGKALMDQCIQAWKKQGVTLFLASHDDAAIIPVADQVIPL